jgi:hypothetical protein
MFTLKLISGFVDSNLIAQIEQKFFYLLEMKKNLHYILFKYFFMRMILAIS